MLDVFQDGAVVVVTSSSGMLLVCLSKQAMTSSPKSKLERFASRSSSTSLTPWLSRFQFSDRGFIMFWRSELEKSVLSGSPCFLLEIGGCDPKVAGITRQLFCLICWKCALLVRRGVAWSQDCLANKLAGVNGGLWTSEMQLAAE